MFHWRTSGRALACLFSICCLFIFASSLWCLPLSHSDGVQRTLCNAESDQKRGRMTEEQHSLKSLVRCRRQKQMFASVWSWGGRLSCCRVVCRSAAEDTQFPNLGTSGLSVVIKVRAVVQSTGCPVFFCWETKSIA